MTMQIEVPSDTSIIVMTRIYDAPRALVWDAMTKPEHVKEWWGGAGFTNPVCEMDVRVGGLWKHVMRFPDGFELSMSFIFMAVEKPSLLVWQHADHGKRREGPPTSVMTATLEDLGAQTRWKLVAEFQNMADREAAQAIGFTKPIEASGDRLIAHLKGMRSGAA